MNKSPLQHAPTLTGVDRCALGALVALGALALSATPAAANDTLAVGAGGTSISVNGTNVSTSSIDLEELGKLQGVPPSTVKLELEDAAIESPEREAIDRLVSELSAETPLSTALDEVSTVSGGKLTPGKVLTRVIAENGEPGANGSNGAPGGAGGAGSAGAPGSSTPNNTAGSTTKKCGALHVSSRRLAGHASSKVRVRFTLPCAATVSYSGRRLAKGSRKLREGKDVLVVKLPRKPGRYLLTLTAASASGRSKSKITLIDRMPKPGDRARH